MATHKLDKFFNEKLLEMEQIPNPAAWVEVEEKLDQSSNKNVWLWLGIAASAALVLVSSWYMLSIDSKSPQVQYSYAHSTIEKAEVPVKIILVPLIIQVRVNSKNEVNTEYDPVSTAKIESKRENPNKDQESIVLVTANTVLEHQLKPILQQPLPVDLEITNELIVASAVEIKHLEPKTTQLPLTIIYKQGSVEPKSKFSQAMNYLEDVRTGNKKLVNFKKIRENIQLKLNSNKDPNSK